MPARKRSPFRWRCMVCNLPIGELQRYELVKGSVTAPPAFTFSGRRHLACTMPERRQTTDGRSVIIAA